MIGVFDSGVGGLTVLRALREKWPAEDFLYLADTARLPYGSKSLATIHNYVEQNLKFLKQYPLKGVVIACNTASTAVVESPIPYSVPVFNVVEPAARKAVETSFGKRIGVLGTRATVFSQAYPHAIKKIAPDAEVFQQPCPLFVPLVEEGWIDDPVTNLIVYRYVAAMNRNNVDTMIMGCTHYPVLEAAIRKAANPGVLLVDSSHGLIEDMPKKIQMKDGAGSGKTAILCTDFSPRLEETIRALLAGQPIESIETVDI